MTVIREHNPATDSWDIVLIGAPGHGLEITGYDTWANISARPSPLDGEVWILAADDPAAPDGGTKGEGMLRSAGAWYNLGPVLQGPTGPAGPAGEPGVDAVGTPLAEETFNFPASVDLSAGGGSIVGLGLSAVSGDALMDSLSLPRPPTWGGTSTLTHLAFKTTGLYMVQGILNLSPTASPNQAITSIEAVTRTGGLAGSNIRGGLDAQGRVFGPSFQDHMALFTTMVWVTNTDAALRFGARVYESGISTWTTPGVLSILKVR